MITPERWRAKPVEGDHVPFTGYGAGGNGVDLVDWLNDDLGVTAAGVDGEIHLDTREREDAVARPGDWIIVGTQGEVYPVSAEVHAAKYERVRP